MSLDTWLSFFLLETLLCLSPGPAVIFSTATAAERGGRAGLLGVAGILLSNTLYFALSATGIAALLIASDSLFTALRWLGGLYLIGMGLSMMFMAGEKRRRRRPHLGDGSVFLQGFLVQSANPKSLVFFAALLPQFINVEAAVVPQVLILGVTSVVIEFTVLAGYVWTALRLHRYLGERKMGWVRILAGAFLVFAGSRLTILEQL